MSPARLLVSFEPMRTKLTPGVFNGIINESTTATSGNTTTDDTEDPEGDESEGFVEFDLDSVAVDLTQVEGDRAVWCLRASLKRGGTRASNFESTAPRASVRARPST